MENLIGGIIRSYLETRKELVERDLRIKEVQGKVITIVGGRRVGKTCYLFKRFQEFRENKKNVIFFSFFDDRIYPPTTKTIQTVIKVARKLYPDGPIYYFFDEIQEVPNWELVLTRLIEQENCYIFVTGSSSKLLSKEIATALRGRALTYELFPFSFKERIGLKIPELGPYFTEKEESIIKSELEDYLKFGGYPEIVLKEDLDKLKTLDEYFNVMLYRDIVERWNIKNHKALRTFMKFILSNFSNKTSITKLLNYFNSLGISVSKNTLYNYLEYAHDAYIVFPLKKFSYSLREIDKSIPKIYVIDNGLLNVVSFNATENIGRLMENIVFLALRRKYKENQELFYYQDPQGYEIDFLIKEGPKIKELIQVTYASEFDEINPREYRALIKASGLFKQAKLTIITWDYEDTKTIKWFGKEALINFVPLWKWLLKIV